MIRPWMGVLGALVAFAAMPAVASAQAPADTTKPIVTVTAPAEGATFVQGQPVLASFACSDDVAVATCVGSTANGQLLDTSALGPHTFTVTATDTSQNTTTETRNFSVVVQDPGPVGGDTPPTLTLTLGTVTPFAPFIPGVGKPYTTTMTAHAVSSAADGTLSVADPSAVNSGHLMNGTYVLAEPLSAAATSFSGTGFPSAPVPSTAAPSTLLTWAGPANEDITLTFTQPIGAGEVLRTGSYSKTLVFTLSTTQP
jgi:hypothetical protein